MSVFFLEYIRTLRSAFSRDTSELPDKWTPNYASIGQCHVTALLIKERFGGLVMEGHAHSDSPNIKHWQQHSNHYWNLIDGITVDATRDQFPQDVSFCHIRIADPPNDTVKEKSALLAKLVARRT